jgi:hypothetical protein
MKGHCGPVNMKCLNQDLNQAHILLERSVAELQRARDDMSNLLNSTGTANVAEKIRQGMLEPFRLDHSDIICSVSIGITLYPDDAGDP